MNDEFINELRAIKVALAEESGFGIQRIAKEIQKSDIQSEAEGWNYIPDPLQPLTHSTFQRSFLRFHLPITEVNHA